MKSNITSKQLSEIRGTALSLIGDSFKLQERVATAIAAAEAIGLCPHTHENVSLTSRLAVIASNAREAQLEQEKVEAADELARVLAGNPEQRPVDREPVSYLGRKAKQLASLLG